MSDIVDDGKRDFLKQAALFGAASGAAGDRDGAERDAGADAGNRRARGLEFWRNAARRACCASVTRRPGRGSTRTPRPANSNGIYKDVVEQLAKEIQVKVEWKEVTFANATIALRRGDFDLFGSSLTYLVPRALAVDFVGPYYSKGSLAAVPQGQCGTLQDRGGRQQARRHVLGHRGRAARSRAFRCCSPPSRRSSPRPARSRSAPSRCAPRRPTCGSAATAT